MRIRILNGQGRRGALTRETRGNSLARPPVVGRLPAALRGEASTRRSLLPEPPKSIGRLVSEPPPSDDVGTEVVGNAHVVARDHGDLIRARRATCCSIDIRAPVPSATIVMTTATPMVTPSSVSADRRRLRWSVRSARRKHVLIRHGIYSIPFSASIGSSRAACRAG